MACAAGKNEIKLNVTFLTRVGLRRNPSRTLQATVNIFILKEIGRKNVVFFNDPSPFEIFILALHGALRIKLNVTFFTPVGLRRNNSRTLQPTVNILTPKE